jgi:hypothetical protein
VRPRGWLSFQAEVVRRVLSVVCLARMVQAIRLLRVRAASPSRPEESVVWPVARGLACLLDQAKPAPQLRPEPLDPRQPLVAGSLLYERQRPSAEERSWDSRS